MTLGQFIDKVVSDYGGQVVSVTMQGPKGPATVRALQRTSNDGEFLWAPLPSIQDDQRLTPDTMKPVLRRLQLPDREFGLVIIL